MAAEREMRVLMTTDTLGGVWNYALELARALDLRGVRIALAAMGAPLTPGQRSQLCGIRALELHESSYKLEWMQQAWEDVDRAGEWLLAVERRFAPDVVHLNQFAFGALPFAAPTLLVAHSCVCSWWRAVHGEQAPASWDEYRHRIAAGLTGASLLAAPTRAMLDSLEENYGVAGGALVLGNGRSAEIFRPAGKQPFIFAAGRMWDSAKNLSALEAVAHQLPWPIRVAGSSSHPDKSPSPRPSPASGRGGTQWGSHRPPPGDGLASLPLPPREGLASLPLCPREGLASLPLPPGEGWGEGDAPSQVTFLGELPVQSMAREMAEASIYALPARYEPFGLSVLEAALSGCALVLGDIPSLREIWGPAALYVPPDDHAALRTALRRLIDDPAERTGLGAAARSRGLHFSTPRMTEAYLAAYAMLQPAFAAATATEEMQCA